MTDVRVSSTPAPAPSATVTSPHDDLQWLVRLTIALVPLGTGWVLWSAPGAESDFNRRVTLAPFDLPLAVLTLVWMRTHVREGRVRRSRLAPTERRPSHDRLLVIIAIALAAAYAVALGAHPSLRGIDLTLRLAGSAAVIDVVRRAEGAQLRRLTVVTVIAAASQALLAIAQSINGRGFDLPPFDHAGPLFRFGDAYAGRGGLSHPYHLVVLLLLGLFAALIGGRHDTGHRLHRWCAASMVIGAGCAVTFSRAMLLAVIPAGLALLITEWRSARPRTLGSVLAGSPRTLGSVPKLLAWFALGLAGGGLAFASGWATRAEQSTAAGADRGRIDKVHLGLEVAAEHPLTGVGPGRYVLALAERGVPEVDLLPTHNVVAQGLAELGLVGGTILTLGIAVRAGRTVRRAGHLALAGAWLLVPFLLLDSYPYVFPTGLAITAVWIGLVEHPMLQRTRPAPDTPPWLKEPGCVTDRGV